MVLLAFQETVIDGRTEEEQVDWILQGFPRRARDPLRCVLIELFNINIMHLMDASYNVFSNSRLNSEGFFLFPACASGAVDGRDGTRYRGGGKRKKREAEPTTALDLVATARNWYKRVSSRLHLVLFPFAAFVGWNSNV